MLRSGSHLGEMTMNEDGRLRDARDVLSVRDLQHILGIGRNATYEVIASGRLPSVRVTPRRIIVTRASLEAFLGLPSNRPADQQ
jgi:predicted DNA-binding transcriptional regulator AlpA